MLYRQAPHALAFFLPALLGSFIGCVDRASEETQPANAATRQQKSQPTPEPERQSPEEDLVQLAGTVDTANRFQSTVAVIVNSLQAPGVGQRCGGVLLDPRLVLTAGHCVCRKQKAQAPGPDERVIIDSTACVTTAIVETVVYEPPTPGEGLGSRRHELQGKVQPHPGLKILLDKEGAIVSSDADLAVILLDSPVRGTFPSVDLAETDIEANEPIIIVGYGTDERLGSLGAARRFNETRVKATPRIGGGRVLFEQPGRHLYKGESGGPCLRESAQSLLLVGISSRNLGKEPTFINTYPYRSWLLEKIHRTAPGGSPDAGR